MKKLLLITIMLFSGIANAAQYTYWLTAVAPPTVATANVLGDSVSTTTHIYGTVYTSMAHDYIYGGYPLEYDHPSSMGTRMVAINDERLATGIYMITGGLTFGVLWDFTYNRWTSINTGGWSVYPTSINNNGQVAGVHHIVSSNKRSSWVYDCTGVTLIDMPGATDTRVLHISDDGVISGLVSGIVGGSYFVAVPDEPFNPMCSLARSELETGNPYEPPVVVEKSKKQLECEDEGNNWVEGKCREPGEDEESEDEDSEEGEG